jgi:hypothetical protein
MSLTHPAAGNSSEAMSQSTINGASIELLPLITGQDPESIAVVDRGAVSALSPQKGLRRTSE